MTDLSIPLSLTGIASHLVYDGLLEPELAEKMQLEAKQHNLPLLSYLVKHNILSSDIILTSCANHFGLPIFDLSKYDPIWLTQSPLHAEQVRRYRVIPLQKINNILHVGISDPTDRHTLDAITFYTGLKVSSYLVAEDQLDNFISHHFKDALNSKNLELNLLKELSLEDNPTLIQENVMNYDEPLIRFVDHIIKHALQQAASDIHIEPYEQTCRIRYRQDGILYETADIPINLATRLVTRLKVMAKLDISERRLPQDGRFQLHGIDVRVNTCPTLFGEKIVLRLLNFAQFSLNINEIGLTETQKNIFLNKISQPQGLILVTGPTGSGKTLTLYSALNYLNTSEKNISTVEDPVEIQLKGINQVNINTKINLHFSHILRTFLRQDPDIIMVGEIRDGETANIAIQASQTGHLVLSTLHTNSAIETITRLQSMGVLAYNMASSTSLIIAQRLARKLCDKCKQPEILSNHALQALGILKKIEHRKIFRAVGCQYCLQGYQGRIGIYELLVVTEKISELIIAENNQSMLLAQARCEGFLTLRENGFEKVLQGLTSLAEINRVTIQ